MKEDIIYSRKKVIEWLKVVVGDMEENMRLLAPNGWEASPYFYFRHPTPEQSYDSYLRMNERIRPMLRNEEILKDKTFNLTFVEYIEEKEEEDLPIRPEVELHELIGELLYNLREIELKDPTGVPIAIEGSRGGATLISQFLNMHYPLDEKEFVYLDFFNANEGLGFIDPLPIYLLFFQRMKEKGYDMFYQLKTSKVLELPSFVQAYQKVYNKTSA